MRSADRRHINYSDKKTRHEILIRQRRGLWTQEQVESLARHFRLRPGMRLLDVGCGHGYALRTWGRYCLPGGELTGLDRDKGLLATAKRHCRREGIGDSCRFVAGDAEELPFEDGVFDMALAHVLFCHLEKPERVLDEMVRVTRPGGCVAVFDNAMGGGPHAGWNNRRPPSLRQRLADFELSQRALDGRRKLGHGDFGVGCRLPSWFEARGLRDVDVRANERVRWIAPPYRSPAQRTELRNLRERLGQAPARSAWGREHDHMRAGGVKERDIRSCRRGAADSRRRLRRAFERGTLAYAWSGQFWCVWGFKPRGKNG